LFSISQSQIPPVVDDLLPMNKFGNIEIWDGLPQFVPKGAFFVEGNFQNAVKVAKLLQIPFVPVVTDFEMKNGRHFPKMGGILILEQHKPLIEDSLYEFNSFKDEQEYDKYQEKVYSRWKKLIRSLLSRQRLKETYGH
jgi:xeroderma pigmentosum group C-complementing protein